MEDTTERNIYAPVLKKTQIFAALSDDELNEILVHCVRRDAKAGDVVLQEGENGNSMLIIAEGSVEYWKGKRKVGQAEAGAFFGEIALLSRGVAKRQATVKAVTDCVLLEFYQPQFKNLLKRHPEVGITTIQTLVDRLQGATPAPLLKSKIGLALVAMLVTTLAKVLSKHLPPDMANETAKLIIDHVEIYALPVISGLGLVWQQAAIRLAKTKLGGG